MRNTTGHTKRKTSPCKKKTTTATTTKNKLRSFSVGIDDQRIL